jgi:hypothetical protein
VNVSIYTTIKISERGFACCSVIIYMLDMRKFMASIHRSTPTNKKLIMMYYSLLRKKGNPVINKD